MLSPLLEHKEETKPDGERSLDPKDHKVRTQIVSVKDTPKAISLRKAKLAVLDGPDAGKELIVDRDVIRVGQREDNDLNITDKTVSRHHFEILKDKEGYILRDLG